MRNIEDLKEWVFIAKSDLDSAVYLADMKPFPTAIICYHSQQCVEKLLKGFLALNGRPVPKTHNLLILHKSCCKLDDKFSLILEQCVQLNGYATDIRYRNVMNRRSLQTLLRNENKGDADLFSLQNHTEYDYIMFDHTEKGDYVPGGLTIEGRRMLLEYLLFTQQEMNTSLISEEEIEAVLQAWYETDGIRVYRDELEPIHHAYLGELVFKPDCTINEEKTTSPFPVFFVEIDVHLGKQEIFRWMKERQKVTQQSFFFFPSIYSNDSAKLTWNKLTFVISRFDITEARDAERIVRQWLGMDMYHGKKEDQHKQMLIQLLIQSIKNEPLFKEDEKTSTKLLYTAEFTNRLARLIALEEPLSEETNHIFAKILKELTSKIFIID
ncbi:hypothetical protein CN424_21415 [Bacillus cereus]|nr:hypothetical protein CN424_21415 [Bacillus cereus]PFO68333.1 hypothetical protein COJ86_19290 [Bacillus cereus]